MGFEIQMCLMPITLINYSTITEILRKNHKFQIEEVFDYNFYEFEIWLKILSIINQVINTYNIKKKF